MRRFVFLLLGLAALVPLFSSSAWPQELRTVPDTRPKLGIARTQLFTAEEYLALLDSLSEAQMEQHRAAGNLAGDRDRFESEGDLPLAIEAAQKCAAGQEALWGPDHYVTAFACGRWGELCHSAGRPKEAEALYRRALKTLVATRGETHPTTLTLEIDLANLLQDSGRFGESLALHKKVVTGTAERYGSGSGDEAVALIGYAAALRDAGAVRNVPDVIDRSLAVLRGKEATDTPVYAQALGVKASVCVLMANYDEARAAYEAIETIYAAEPERYAVPLAMLHKNRAELSRRQGRFPDAQPQLDRARELLSGVDPGHPAFAAILLEQSALYHALGRSEWAERDSRQAAEILLAAYGKTHPEYGVALRNLAVISAERGRLKAAEPLLGEALDIFRSQFSDRHPLVAQTLQDLARVQQGQDNSELARELVDVAAQVAAGYLGAEHPEYARHLVQAARLYRDMKEYGLAEAALRSAGEVIGNELGKDHPEYAQALVELGSLYGAMQKDDEGKTLVKEGGRILSRRLGSDHPDVARTVVALAELYSADEAERAEKALTMAAETLAEQISPRDRKRLEALVELGDIYMALQQPDAAEKILDEAVSLLKEEVVEESPLYRKAVGKLAEVERIRQKIERATDLEAELGRISQKVIERNPRTAAFARIAAEIEQNNRR